MAIYTAAFVKIAPGATLEQLAAEARADWDLRNTDVPTHLIIPVGFTDQAIVADLKVVESKQVRSIIGVGIVVEAPK